MLSSESAGTDSTPPSGEAGNSDPTSRKSPQQSPRPAQQQDKNVNPLEKIESLLTCSICLDRYKTPKLLPCMHTYCLPCLDNYADTVHHNLKCPECRAEHSIPYEGAKGFPTNLTLAGFLDIHLEATDDNSEQIEAYIHRYNMERCKICDEKAELEVCHHCERKTCKECRNAHMEMLKRDLGRLLNQIRRLSNRVKEASDGVSKGIQQLDSNVQGTQAEIRDYFQRYQAELKRREEHFLGEVELFGQNERRLMQSVRDTLNAEHANLSDACTLVDSALNGKTKVLDEELCRYKTVFVDGVEFLRNFQPDTEDMFSKKVRFSPGDDASKLPTAICNFGELTVSLPQFAGRYLPLENQYLPRPLRMGLESNSYKTSYRTTMEENSARMSKYSSNNKRSTNNNNNNDDTSSSSYRRRTHSFLQLDDEPTITSRPSSNRLRVGGETSGSGRSSPLNFGANNGTNSNQNAGSSLIGRSSFLSDRSAPSDPVITPTTTIVTELREEPSPANKNSAPATTSDLLARRQQAQKRSSMILPDLSNTTQIENSELKTQNPNDKNAATSTPLAKQKSAIDSSSDQTSNTAENIKKPDDSPIVIRMRQKPPLLPRQASSNESDKSAAGQRSSLVTLADGAVRRRSLIIETTQPVTSAAKSSDADGDTTVLRPTRRQKFKIICRSTSSNPLKRSDSADSLSGSVLRDSSSSQRTSQQDGQNGEPKTRNSQQQPDRSSTAAGAFVASSANSGPSSNPSATSNAIASSSSSPLSYNRNSSTTNTLRNGDRAIRDQPVDSSPPPLTPTSRAAWMERRRQRFLRSRTNPDILSAVDLKRSDSTTAPPRTPTTPSSSSVYSSALATSALASRVQQLLNELNDFKPTLVAENATAGPLSPSASSSQRTALNGSTSSKRVDSDEQTDSPTRFSRRSSIVPDREFSRERSRSRLSRQSSTLITTPYIDYGSKSKPRLVFGRRGDGPSEMNWPRGIAVLPGSEFAVCDSSNHRVQIFNKNGKLLRKFGVYGSAEGQLDSCAAVAYNRNKQQLVVSDRYNHRIQLFDLEGQFVKAFGGHGTENGKFNNPWGVALDELGCIYVVDKDNHRVQVFDQNGNFMSKFGSKGDGIGQFNHPLFVAIHQRTQNLFISDSANHRICVYDHDGVPILHFGVEGFHTGQLKLPRGLAVDDQGFVIVADSGNNRVQVFSPDGKFVHGFGTWGVSPGQLKGIEGVALMDQQIIVSDRENHRVQVF